MTLIDLCGFECGQLAAHGFGSGGTIPTFVTSPVKNGARALSCAGAVNQASYFKTSSNNSAIKVVKIDLYFNNLPVSVSGIIAGNVNGGGAYFNPSDSKIYCGFGIADIGSTGVAITTGSWITFDVRVDMSANPHVVDVKVNGTSCSQHTKAISASSELVVNIGNVRGGSGNETTIYCDNFAISHTAGDYPLTGGYVNHFVPTADGAHNVAGAADFRRGDTTTDILNSTTTAYQLVDDVPMDDTTPDTDDHIRIVAPPNVTDYVELVFGPAPGISTPTVAPLAVMALTEHFAAGTFASDEIAKLNDNGTVDNIYDGTGVAGTTTGIYKSKMYNSPPTGGLWTVVSGAGNFNNIRLRYGYATDANPDKSLMCTMIEAWFGAQMPTELFENEQRYNALLRQ